MGKGFIKASMLFASLCGLGALVNELDKRFSYRYGGYNRMGYDRMGYDRDGYDSSGRDREGYNLAGYNAAGLDRDGRDEAGYDVHGFNKEGRDSQGFDVSGYDKDGYQRSGLDKYGYSRDNIDVNGHTRDYYMLKTYDMKDLLYRAHKQMKDGNESYALLDIRLGLEEGVKAVLSHSSKGDYSMNKLHTNLELCKRYKLLDTDTIDKLMSAKSHCNDVVHSICDKEFNQFFFCYKVLEELIAEVKRITDIKENS